MQWWAHQQLKSKRPETRRQAIAKLALEGTPEAIQLLCLSLGDLDRQVRLMALRALSPLRVSTAANAFVGALHDADPEVREAAVVALMQLSDPSVVPALENALKDAHPSVRQRAAKALDFFGRDRGGETQVVRRTVVEGDFAQATHRGEAPLRSLLASLKDQRNPDRCRVVETLSRIGGKQVVGPLLAALQDQDPHLRVAVLEALARVQDKEAKEAGEPILSVLKDKEPVVRAAAAATLGTLGDSGALHGLLPLLNDTNPSVRKETAAAVGRLRQPYAVDPLVKALGDSDCDVREAVATALGHIGERLAIQYLVVILADPQPSVRKASVDALRNIDPQWLCSSEARRAIPALTAALSSRDRGVRQGALDILRRLTESNSGEVSASTTEAPEANGTVAVRALLGILGDWDRDLRLAGAEALGRLANPEVRDALIAASRDPDEWVTQAVAEALSRLPPSSGQKFDGPKGAQSACLHHEPGA